MGLTVGHGKGFAAWIKAPTPLSRHCVPGVIREPLCPALRSAPPAPSIAGALGAKSAVFLQRLLGRMGKGPRTPAALSLAAPHSEGRRGLVSPPCPGQSIWSP
jgi:hypothetical protein